MTMKTTEKKIIAPSKQLRNDNRSRIKELVKELEELIFTDNNYDPRLKDYHCINFQQNQTILQQNQVIIEKLEKNGSQKKKQFSKPGIYMPMPKELQQGARIVSSMVRADTWEEFWIKVWDNRREIVDLLNKTKIESNISLKEQNTDMETDS